MSSSSLISILHRKAAMNAMTDGSKAYPSGGSSWTMRMQIAFLFPKLSPPERKMLMEEQLKKLEQQ